jgi:hypothetical protein
LWFILYGETIEGNRVEQYSGRRGTRPRALVPTPNTAGAAAMPHSSLPDFDEVEAKQALSSFLFPGLV